MVGVSAVVRPLPKEALEKGSMTLSKKEKERLEKEELESRKAGLEPGGRTELQDSMGMEQAEIPREGLVCG